MSVSRDGGGGACRVKSEAEEITSVKTEGLKIKGGRDAEKVCMSGRGRGGVVYKWKVGRRRRERKERGKEKTLLPQHDLQIALSPWRLLSAPHFDPKW